FGTFHLSCKPSAFSPNGAPPALIKQAFEFQIRKIHNCHYTPHFISIQAKTADSKKRICAT
ncbi:MAG: hypothetical protein LUC20_08145, partial [Oscillospiraceae bacterium]|nr:hypothetical protein [Oscillospiraceae bacterium]